MSGTFLIEHMGGVLAKAPSETSPRPKQWASWPEWMNHFAYRGLAASAGGGGVMLGLFMASEPLDEAFSFITLPAYLTPEAAMKLAENLIAAAHAAEAQAELPNKAVHASQQGAPRTATFSRNER
jgi:hypothetical protein